jgi:hypothetical protein
MAGAEIAQSIEFGSMRGMAWADLASIAARIPAAARRHAAYSIILNDMATCPLTIFRNYVTNGMVAALAADPAPMPVSSPVSYRTFFGAIPLTYLAGSAWPTSPA